MISLLTSEDLLTLNNTLNSLASRITSLETSRTAQETLNIDTTSNIDNIFNRVVSAENRIATLETTAADHEARIQAEEANGPL